MSLEIFLEECKFFQIPASFIDNMLNSLGILPELNKLYQKPKSHVNNGVRAKMWNIMEKPETSCFATCFTLFSLLAVLVSIAATVIETSFEIESNKLSENHWLQLGQN